ncbi:hypothetical protein EW026_g1565 [Hermanssonia centrifuga]|uniref:Uncharacterized protein n=1 Tax=Hermanssonia centrifuga TaxID=98765 RepID=A0A4S4KRK1_9APHY|nr:hypothetical protein EW026_g1565 [Hermanssonia centrifuga]
MSSSAISLVFHSLVQLQVALFLFAKISSLGMLPKAMLI